MDPDKSAVFAYDGVPGSQLDLAGAYQMEPPSPLIS